MRSPALRLAVGAGSENLYLLRPAGGDDTFTISAAVWGGIFRQNVPVDVYIQGGACQHACRHAVKLCDGALGLLGRKSTPARPGRLDDRPAESPASDMVQPLRVKVDRARRAGYSGLSLWSSDRR